ncbi:trimeric intracellular cation channel family protein [Mangrovibacterium marinum]|uniref:Putative membrane protein YeiH n=1 Tax=Mangrovibacterium marinum TaxID=1639118 RepID=A0A2T5C4Y7_9BACT|nr:trimeric intracellular cation channel family protein [Mangrovibacterium marinum]PTN09906.1 putative membrane protein YeiH [Mangrovibacterium marinum]
MNLLLLFDYIGTFVFAISGTLTAANKRLDFFGATMIGFVTAVGGGSLRDMMLGDTPVAWMRDLNYFWLIIAGVLVTIAFGKVVMTLKKTLFLFDTIGIAVFTIIGLKKALMMGINIPLAVMMGLASAVVGGVIRDTLCNELPLIFHREIYATACIAGALVYLLLNFLGMNEHACEIATVGSIITIRLIAVRFDIALPKIELKE